MKGVPRKREVSPVLVSPYGNIIKPAAKQADTDVISARFQVDTLRKLEIYCRVHKMKKSEFLRQAVEEVLNARLRGEEERNIRRTRGPGVSLE